ncbi:hypothetical protein [Pontibacter sp. HJ8]
MKESGTTLPVIAGNKAPIPALVEVAGVKTNNGRQKKNTPNKKQSCSPVFYLSPIT